MFTLVFIEIIFKLASAFCPLGFTETEFYCHITKETAFFPYECPYALPLSTSRASQLNITSPYWLTRRDENYGHFIEIDIYDHVTFYDDKEIIYMEGTDLQCLYRTNKPVEYFLSNCNNTAVVGVCIYNKEDKKFCDAYHKICNRTCNGKSKYKNHFQCGAMFDENGSCEYCDQEYENYPNTTMKIYRHSEDSIRIEVQNVENAIYSLMGNGFFRCFFGLHDGLGMFAIVITDLIKKVGPYIYELNSGRTGDGIYYCVLPTYPNGFYVQSNEVIITSSTKEETFHYFIANITTDMPYIGIPYHLLKDEQNKIKIFLKSHEDLLLVKPMVIYPQVNNTITIGFQITAHGSSLESVKELILMIRELLPARYTLLNCQYCVQEELIMNGKTLTWPTSKLGTVAPTKELLVTKNGLPITRSCDGTFKTGGIWSAPRLENVVTASAVTKALFNILMNTNLNAEEINIQLSEIIAIESNVIPYDVYLISKCLERMIYSGEEYNVETAISTIESTMKFNPSVLYTSQIKLNATDMILYVYDRILQDQIIIDANFTSQSITVQGDQTIGQIFDLNGPYNGVAIYETSKDISFLYLNIITNHTEIDKTNLIIALYLPSDLLIEIESTLKNTINLHFISSIFLNNKLFNDEETRDNWQVMTAFVPGLRNTIFSNQLPVIFGERYANPIGTKCSYWLYGTNDEQVGIFGKWKDDGIMAIGENYRICYYNHMTHFSLMFGAPEDKAINVVTAIVTSLSLISILSIFITAMVYKKWRREEGVKILLHYSITIMIQDFLILIFDLINVDKIWCTIYGSLLHFSILAQFIWMLIINYIQYRKLVKVFESGLSNNATKFVTIAWLLPLIPITIVLAIDLNAYRSNTYCFVSDFNLYLSLFLPMSLIIFVNSVIFIRILMSLFQGSNAVGNSLLKQRISIVVLLFFLSGFTWTFGLLANAFQNIVVSYIFCILSTVQGVILWIFFILMRQDVVIFWLKSLKKFHTINQPIHRISGLTSDTITTSNFTASSTDTHS